LVALGGFVFLSLYYLVLRRVLELAVLCCRSTEFKELELVVLRQEVTILRRRVPRPTMTWSDRLFLAAASQLLPKVRWRSFIVTPTTLLRWHRRLVAKRWTFARPVGRPAMRAEIRALALRLARENPRWGYQRIVGELKSLGRTVSATTVRTWLRQAGVGPAGRRRGMTWREFIRTHRQSLLAVDFLTVETVWLQRLYVLFFIELGSRRVYLAGCIANPSAPWVTQQARQLTWKLAEHPERTRFLIRDRDQKFTDRFDDVFRGDGIEIVRTPFRAPQANGVAERFVRTVRSECLDWLLILNQSHLEHVLSVFVDHYNSHRPHRALDLQPPYPTRPREQLTKECDELRVQRRDRLGGLIHEYSLVA
jgi:putative transposase